jgi:deoxycytidine triphosphate deaminase
MFINPKHAIAEGWVKFPEWMPEEFQQRCIQPNALDFTVDHMYGINDDQFQISEAGKLMRTQYPLAQVDGMFHLNKGCYDAMSDFYVTVPEGVAAHLITRSTFNRNGLFIQSGLYDSGFRGNCGFVIYNMGGSAVIAPHTRIGQLIFTTSEDSGKLYAGGYNTEAGQHWTTKESK